MERKQGLRYRLNMVKNKALEMIASVVEHGMEQNAAHMRIRAQHGTPMFNSRRIQPGHGGTPNKYRPHVGHKQMAKLAGTYPNRFGQAAMMARAQA